MPSAEQRLDEDLGLEGVPVERAPPLPEPMQEGPAKNSVWKTARTSGQ